jgi:hypothetical protein
VMVTSTAPMPSTVRWCVVVVMSLLVGLMTGNRAVRHRLTERGEELRRAGDALVNEVFAESFAALAPAQLDQLGALLGQVLEPSATPAR